MKNIFITVFVVIGYSCSLLTFAQQNTDASIADLVLTNGYIYTVDTLNPLAQSVAIKDGKFIYVGSNDSISKYICKTTEVVDLKNSFVLPGFIDSHCHSISGYKQFIDLNFFGLNSIEEYQKAIKAYRETHPEITTLVGRGWSNTLFAKTGPDKRLIDAIVNDIPVSISSEDGHSKWVNSKTLELAGIIKETPNPPEGIIEKDSLGEPTGTLRENAADLIAFIFPTASFDKMKKGLIAYQKIAASFGITGLHEGWLDAGSNEPEVYRSLMKEGNLTLRVRASLYIDPNLGISQIEKLIDEREKNNSDLFQTNSAKLFIDGVVEGSTAYLSEPYNHLPDSRGELLCNIDSLRKTCSALEKNGFQIHVHSIGDAATKIILDAFEFSKAKNIDTGYRNSITHLQLVETKDILRFRKLGVVAVPQPYWFVKDNYYYNIQLPYLGKRRADSEYPMKSFFDAGVVVASASDYPVTVPCNPLKAIQYGVTRCLPDSDTATETLWPEERVTLDQMIKSFTLSGAYADFLENETGSISCGKSADLIVLDKNLFFIPSNEIATAKCLLTLFKGRRVFTSGTM